MKINIKVLPWASVVLLGMHCFILLSLIKKLCFIIILFVLNYTLYFMAGSHDPCYSPMIYDLSPTLLILASVLVFWKFWTFELHIITGSFSYIFSGIDKKKDITKTRQQRKITEQSPSSRATSLDTQYKVCSLSNTFNTSWNAETSMQYLRKWVLSIIQHHKTNL